MATEFHIKSRSGDTPVLVGPGLLREAGSILAGRCNPGQIAILSDETVADLYLEDLKTSLTDAGFRVAVILVPPGEGSKSFKMLEMVCRELLQNNLGKNDILIALGGGVVGDLAGLAACLTRRGLNLVMAPTTLLAQVDSSIGGKNAINTPEGKNLIGTIRAPMMVLDDTSTLESLPAKQLSAGYAEVIKHGVLAGEDHFSYLESSVDKFFSGDASVVQETIAKSIRFKAEIVERDEKDAGPRNLLNLGHTFAHAFESVATISHGRAVAAGLCLAFQFAHHIGHDVAGPFQRTTALLKKADLPTTMAEAGLNCRSEDLLKYIKQDKKITDGEIKLIVPKGLGDVYIKDLGETETLENFFAAINI